MCTIQSPGKHHMCKKMITNFDDFNKAVCRCTIFNMQAARECPTAEKTVIKMNEAVGFYNSVRSMLHILKSTGFKHARCDDGRKFLMEMQ